MFANYFKTAIRNFARHTMFSIVNVAGLAIGIACSILILVYTQYELSYDRFHENADNTYRVLVDLNLPEGYSMFTEGSSHMNMTPTPLRATLEDNFPEIVRAVSFGTKNALISHGDKSFSEPRFCFAEPDFLDLFTHPLLSGDPNTVLAEPYTVVLTEETAHKLFGEEDPIGKYIQYGTVFELKVTGVCQNVPANSHFHFDYIGSGSTVTKHWGSGEPMAQGMTSVGGGSNWNQLSNKTYVQFQPGTDVGAFGLKFNSWVKQFYTGEGVFTFFFQPMTDIHLRGNASGELEVNSDIKYVYFLAAMALLILLIACFNYMNLSTARSANRAREVGMRKVVGAGRFDLIRQFLGESLMLTAVALGLAILTVELVLPVFSDLVGTQLEVDWLANKEMLALLALLGLLVGVVAGAYPALLLSSFRPMNILKGTLTVGSSGSRWFRNCLVVFQYGISIILISCTLIVYQQLEFMRSKDVGFETENIMALPIRDFRLLGSFRGLKKELLDQPGILSLATSAAYPSQSGGGASRCWWEGQSEDDFVPFNWTDIDYDYLDFYGIELAAGRNFSREFSTDVKEAYILNETAVRKIGWDDPIGKRFGLHKGRKGTVVGVVSDFHFRSLHEEIEPMAMMPGKGLLRNIALKVDSTRIVETIAFLEDIWPQYSKYPLNYFSFDDRIAAQYQSENRLFKIFSVSTAIAILVACLGLFGLASFTAEKRSREIGIRKVMGASVTGIVMLLLRQFSKWVLLAGAISWPLAHWGMTRWLQDYSYRIDLDWRVFAIAAVSALMVAVLTITYQAVRAARADPVKTLRCD